MSAEGLVFLPLKQPVEFQQVTGNTFGASGASNKKPNKIGPMHSAMLFPVVKAPGIAGLPTKKQVISGICAML